MKKRNNDRSKQKESKCFRILNIVIYVLIRVIFIFACVSAAINGHYLTAMMSVVAIFVFSLPSLFDKKFNIELPTGLEISAVVFAFMSVIGGEFAYMYARFPMWDNILHGSSGFLIAAIGLALIEFLNKNKRMHLHLTPFFIVAFAFCFTVTVEVAWEVFEFAVDKFTGVTDMQADHLISSFASKKAGGEFYPSPIVVDKIESVIINFEGGREPLVLPAYIDIGIEDTMYDLIIGCIGAFIFCGIEFFALVHKSRRARKISDSFVPKKRPSKEEAAANAVISAAVSDIYSKVDTLAGDKKEK